MVERNLAKVEVEGSRPFSRSFLCRAMMNPIICAIDTHDLKIAMSLADSLKDKICMLKLGLEFFTAHGISGIKEVAKSGLPIFLDLKLHDIPNTVAKTLEVIKEEKGLNVEMLTLHVSGGEKMLKEALNVVRGTKIKLIGVTVLTSMDNKDLSKLGVEKEVDSQVMLLAKFAKNVGLHGIVCSAWEAKEVCEWCGKDFKIVTPGIRMESNFDDQKRTATPKEAIELGANYIVIGRPITETDDPANSAELILKSLKA